MLERRGWIIGGAALLLALCLAALPHIRFDFDPLNLKNPNSESVFSPDSIFRIWSGGRKR